MDLNSQAGGGGGSFEPPESPLGTGLTRPNQVPNSQTVSIDVNSASPSDSQDQSDDEGTQGSNPQQSTGSILILDSGQLAET